jgi:aerobic-type carbon monoxide dehydrogenase small subunit (CoxS/CutS family)
MSEFNSNEGFSISRRSFLKTFGTSAAVAATAQVEAVARELEKADGKKILGPGAVPVTLQVNGKPLSLQLEPRVTLLEALRDHAGLTGAKEVCDRAACGACTVLLDDKPVYACALLAVEAQGHAITTVEGLAKGGKLSAVEQAFVDEDALMCGYCTPGFVMSVTALLKQNPHPKADDVKRACEGNLCRCGAYPRIVQAALKAAGVSTSSKTEVISYAKLA